MSTEAAQVAQLPMSALADVLPPLAGSVMFAAGSRIFNEAEAGDHAYLIESGYVEIARDMEGMKQVVAVLGPGEIFGEMAAIDRRSRSASATAMHDTVVVPIAPAQIEAALASTNPLTRLLIWTTIGRLRAPTRSDGPSTSPSDLSERLFRETRSAATEHVKLASEIRSGLEQNQFEVHFQPIVDLADGRPAGAEALVRWSHPSRGIVSPGAFIPAAEDTGLIVPLGLWIMERALASVQTLEAGSRVQVPFVSVNVAPRQLENESDLERLIQVIDASGVAPERIKLEITEQALHDPASAMVSLERLRETGAQISIDDFGSGYSSLNHLCRYPVDTLKIDRGFVMSLDVDRRGRQVVSAILSMARELELNVVAEGIETLQQFH